MNERVIFLDFDGVLNNLGSVLALGSPSRVFDPVSVGLIRKLCDKTNAGIVVSSSWRVGRSIEDLIEDMTRCGAGSIAAKVIDKTPGLGVKRGHEIAEWIKTFSFTGQYVIVDDDSDMLPCQQNNFIHTTWEDGFRVQHYRRALSILAPGVEP